jgi:hypothetical protein
VQTLEQTPDPRWTALSVLNNIEWICADPDERDSPAFCPCCLAHSKGCPCDGCEDEFVDPVVEALAKMGAGHHTAECALAIAINAPREK